MNNKALSLFLFFFILASLAAAASAGEEIQLTHGELLTQRTSIYGNHVFWTDTYGYGVHVLDLTSGKQIPMPSHSERGEINSYGNKVVWTGDADSVHLGDISNGEDTQIASGRRLPDIYGNYIVYTNNYYGQDHQNDGIYLYDLNTHNETKIANAYSSPAIYDTKVVWSQANSNNGYDIRKYDISTNQTNTITTTNSLILESELDIYGNVVVWRESSNIYMYDIASNKTTQVTNSGYAREPVIYENRIVYTMGDPYVAGSDIYMYEISTARTTRITTSTRAFAPSIYGDKIVYADSRNAEYEVDVLRDIYLYDLNPETEKLKALFVMDVTTGIAPLNVSFSDISSGIPNAWYWDFGDGTFDSTINTKQNPMHTYLKAGNYIVTLAASDYNSTAYKSALITVSEQPVLTLPIANFTANPMSGYAPLTVQFANLSQNATVWNWDFGDGTNSTEQNPTHIYSSEGSYNANLTVSNANGTDSKIETINVLQTTSSSGGGSYGGSSGGSCGGSFGGSFGTATVVSSSSGSTVNTSATANVTQPENNTSNLEQNNESTATNVEQIPEKTPEKTQSPNTSSKESTKTPGFETFFGIVSLLLYFYIKENKEGN